MKQWLSTSVAFLFVNCRSFLSLPVSCIDSRHSWLNAECQQQNTGGLNSRTQMGWMLGGDGSIRVGWVLIAANSGLQYPFIDDCSTYMHTNAIFRQRIVLSSKCLLKMLRWCEWSCNCPALENQCTQHLQSLYWNSVAEFGVSGFSCCCVSVRQDTWSSVYICNVVMCFVYWCNVFLHVLCVTCADYNIAGLHWRGQTLNTTVTV